MDLLLPTFLLGLTLTQPVTSDAANAHGAAPAADMPSVHDAPEPEPEPRSRTARIRWPVPTAELGYVRRRYIAPNSFAGASDRPLQTHLDVSLRLPVHRTDDFILVGGLQYEHLSPHGSEDESYRDAQLGRLYYVAGSLSGVVVQSPSVQHVASLVLGYGGDMQTMGAAGLRYSLAYTYLWNNRVDTQAGVGLALTRVGDFPLLPIPFFLVTHRFGQRWLVQATLPQQAMLRYSVSSDLFAGVFTRLNSKNYYLTKSTRETANGLETRAAGELAVLRVEAGPEVNLRVAGPLFLRLEGGAAFEAAVPFSTATAQTVASNLGAQAPYAQDHTLQSRLTWFTGAGISMLF